MPLAFAGADVVLLLARAQRVVSNFLASASAFRDRAKVYMLKLYGEDSLEWATYENTRTGGFQALFGYRLYYYLRNYAQHQAIPISLMKVNAQFEEAAPTTFDVRLTFTKDEFLKSSYGNAAFRSELKAMPDDPIELIPLARECMDCHRELLLDMMLFQAARLQNAERYGAVVMSKIPNGFNPVLWVGPSEANAPPKNCILFMLDELKLFLEVAKRLPAQAEKS